MAAQLQRIMGQQGNSSAQQQTRPRPQSNNPQDLIKNVASEAGREAASAIGEQLGMGGQNPEEAPNPDAFDEQAYRDQAARKEQQRLAELKQLLENEIAKARGERVQSQQEYIQHTQEQMDTASRGGLSEEEYAQEQQEKFIPEAVKARQGSREQGKRKG